MTDYQLEDLSQKLWGYLESFNRRGSDDTRVVAAHDAILDDIEAAIIDIEGIDG